MEKVDNLKSTENMYKALQVGIDEMYKLILNLTEKVDNLEYRIQKIEGRFENGWRVNEI